MDWFTHGAVPALVLTLARRPVRERAAIAIGGMAPDLDFAWAWTQSVEPTLYWLGHRGLSHTVWGSPAMALAAWWIITRPAWQLKWPALATLTTDRRVVAMLIAGAWLHLLFDAPTIVGVPALWPLTSQRWRLDFYFFIHPALAIISGMALLWGLRGRLNHRLAGRTLAAWTILFLTITALRAATYPYDAPPDAAVAPTGIDWQWTVAYRNETGVVVETRGWGGPAPSFLPEPNRTAAAGAIAACQSHADYVSWQWERWTFDWVEAQPTPDGAWNLTIRDAAREHGERTSPWPRPSTKLGHEVGTRLECTVGPDGIAHLRYS